MSPSRDSDPLLPGHCLQTIPEKQIYPNRSNIEFAATPSSPSYRIERS